MVFALIVLAVMVGLLMVERAWAEQQHVRERRHLTHLLTANRASEVAVMENAVTPMRPRPKPPVRDEDGEQPGTQIGIG